MSTRTSSLILAAYRTRNLSYSCLCSRFERHCPYANHVLFFQQFPFLIVCTIAVASSFTFPTQFIFTSPQPTPNYTLMPPQTRGQQRVTRSTTTLNDHVSLSTVNPRRTKHRARTGLEESVDEPPKKVQKMKNTRSAEVYPFFAYNKTHL